MWVHGPLGAENLKPKHAIKILILASLNAGEALRKNQMPALLQGVRFKALGLSLRSFFGVLWLN